MKKIGGLLFVFLLVTVNCSSGNEKDYSKVDTCKVIALSATSAQSGHPVGAVMDNAIGTFWAPAGDANDEGILIRFLKPSEISSLEVVGSGNNVAFGLYINGSYRDNLQPNKSYPIGLTGVSVIYLRVNNGSSGVKVSEIKINQTQTDDKFVLKAPQFVKAAVNSSSALEPKISYAADQLFDNRLDFGWAEGKNDDGIGETVSIDFDKKLKFDALYIANGYQRSDDHFTKNSRVKKLSVTVDGQELPVFTLKDEQGYQKVDLGKTVDASRVVLKIVSVYPGTKYKDTLISELAFSRKGNIIIPETGFLDAISAEYSRKAKGTILEKIVEKNLVYTYAYPMEETEGEIRIRLRNNGSFVIWKSESGTGSSKEFVLEGNWIIKENSSGKAVVYIFGKRHETSETTEYADWEQIYYGGGETTTVNKTDIFSDNLTITRYDGKVKEESAKMTFDAYVTANPGEDAFLISGKEVFGLFPSSVVFEP